MVALAANVNSTEGIWTLDAALTASPGDKFRVGDEIIEFGGYRPDTTWGPKLQTNVSVNRGIGGSVAASHLSGVTLTPVELAFTSEVPPVSASGEQTVRLLGPFHVEHDDAGLFGDGIELEVLEAGAVVVTAWAIITESFNGNSIGMWLGLGDAPTGDWITLVKYMQLDSSPPWPLASAMGPGSLAERDPRQDVHIGIATASTAFLVSMGTENGDPLTTTTGEADVYALIAEPAV